MTDMKFGDIKQGDIVYVRVGVPINIGEWGRSSEYFWIPKKVDKVSPKQFVVANKRYKRENGDNIGGGYHDHAARLGDVFNNSPVVDQTTEKKSLLDSMQMVWEIEGLNHHFKINYDHPNIVGIHTKIKEIESLLNEGNK